MYGSAVSLLHGLDAYDFSNIASVFNANHVIEPARWYAHAPVYPPFTLAVLTPFAALPMGPAIYAWFLVCAGMLACALASLARVAGEEFGLSRWWRFALIALGAAWPLFSFGLEMENVSIVVSALCVLAVTTPAGSNRWLRAAGLALALLLKPHLAIWVVIAMLLMPNRRGRWMAWRGIALGAVVGGVLMLAMAVRGDLGMQIASYRAVLHAELAGGSMNAGNHELMDVSAQILSLDSLVSFYASLEPAARALTGVLLVGAAGLLLWATTRSRKIGVQRYPLVAAWCGLGMLATYHRAHDGAVLMLMLPWILARLHASWRDAGGWIMLAALAAMGTAPRWETYEWLETLPGLHGIAELMLYRQAPFAALVLAAMLVALTVHVAWREQSADNRAAALGALRA